jgi:hypothetical protein
MAEAEKPTTIAESRAISQEQAQVLTPTEARQVQRDKDDPCPRSHASFDHG